MPTGLADDPGVIYVNHFEIISVDMFINLLQSNGYKLVVLSHNPDHKEAIFRND